MAKGFMSILNIHSLQSKVKKRTELDGKNLVGENLQKNKILEIGPFALYEGGDARCNVSAEDFLNARESLIENTNTVFLIINYVSDILFKLNT